MAATLPALPNPVNPAPITVGGVRRPGIADALGGSTITVTSGATDLHDAIYGVGAFAGLGAIDGSGNHKGNTYVCPAGATYSPLQLPAAGTGFTRITSSADIAGNLPRGTRVTPSNAALFYNIVTAGVANHALDIPGIATGFPGNSGPWQSNGWNIIGARLAQTGMDGFSNQIVLAWGDRIIFERCWINGPTFGAFNGPNPYVPGTKIRGIYVQGGDFQLWDSWLDNCVSDDEVSPIWTRTFDTSGLHDRHHYENNHFEGSGQCIFIGDQSSPVSTKDVTVLRNHLFKPTTWRMRLADGTINPTYIGDPNARDAQGRDIAMLGIKNGFEIKSCVRALIEGNIIENDWRGSQNGEAFVLGEVDIQDITFRNNKCINNNFFCTVNDGQSTNSIQRVNISNNLSLATTEAAYFLAIQCQDTTFQHNTIVPQAGPVQQGGASYALQIHPVSAGSIARPTMLRNIFGPNATGPNLLNFGGGGAAFDDPTLNTELPDRTFLENAIYNMGSFVLPATGFTSYATSTTAGVNLTDGTLLAGSPLINAGSDTYSDSSNPRFGQRTDIGVDFFALNNALQGVQGPTTVPVANFTYTPVLGTRTINFQDISNNGGSPITGRAWTGPDGFSSNTNNPTPSFTFPTSGPKSIILTDTNALGSSVPVTIVITVPPLPHFSHVQTTQGGRDGSLTVTVPSLTVGNLLIVWVNRANAASPLTITGVSDPAGNVYTALTAQTVMPGVNSQGTSRAFYTVVTAGSPSPLAISAVISGTTPTCRVIAQEYHPALGPAIALVGASPMQGGTGSSMDSGAVTTTADGQGLFGYFDQDAVVPTMQPGFTARGVSGNNFTGDNLAAFAGTYHFTPRFGGSMDWLAALVAFSSGPGGTEIAPTVPTGLTNATPVAPDHVDLSWMASFNSLGIANYDVARNAVIVGNPVGTTFTDSNLQQQTTYVYTVRAREAGPQALVSAFSPGLSVTTGTIPIGVGLPPRFMRGFGAVRGTGPTDAIQTPNLAGGAQRTIAFWLRLDSVAVQQCVFTKSSTAVPSLTERLLVVPGGGGTLHFQRQWAGGLGEWSVPIPPSLGIRHFLVIRYDSSAVANVPIIKIDNVQQVVTTVAAPTGANPTVNVSGYLLGNVPGGGSVLGGDLGVFVAYDFMTTDLQDVALFGANPPLGIGVGPVQYVVLAGAGNEPDLVTNALSTLTGTVTQDYNPPGPSIFTAGRVMVGWR